MTTVYMGRNSNAQKCSTIVQRSVPLDYKHAHANNNANASNNANTSNNANANINAKAHVNANANANVMLTLQTECRPTAGNKPQQRYSSLSTASARS